MLLGYAGLIAPTETIHIVFAEPLDSNQSRHVASPAVGQRPGLLEAASTPQALGFTGSPAIDLVTEPRR
jgi:hypothetical protein